MGERTDAGRPRILCVDDDAALLELLSRHLRADYEVVTAPDGESALKMIGAEPGIAVVVADMKMPRMDGATLLAQIKHAAPNVVRVMLTGEADQTVAAQAVNSGQIFRFLTKGCTREQLRRAVADSVEQHHLLVAERALLEGTLLGAVQALMDALAVVNPVAFGRAHRLRRLTLEIAKLGGVSYTWMLESAALLSQLGYLSVGQEVLERMLSGGRLSNTERRQLDRVPSISCDLLKKIPRLEPVVELIAGLDASFGPNDANQPTAVDILRIAADYDRYLVQTGEPELALQALRAHLARYSPVLLTLLATHIGAEIKGTIREVPLNMVTAGMVLIEAVRTETGALLVPPDFEVTSGFLERLRNFPPGVVDRAVRVRSYTSLAAPSP